MSTLEIYVGPGTISVPYVGLSESAETERGLVDIPTLRSVSRVYLDSLSSIRVFPALAQELPLQWRRGPSAKHPIR